MSFELPVTQLPLFPKSHADLSVPPKTRWINDRDFSDEIFEVCTRDPKLNRFGIRYNKIDDLRTYYLFKKEVEIKARAQILDAELLEQIYAFMVKNDCLLIQFGGDFCLESFVHEHCPSLCEFICNFHQKTNSTLIKVNHIAQERYRSVLSYDLGKGWVCSSPRPIPFTQLKGNDRDKMTTAVIEKFMVRHIFSDGEIFRDKLNRFCEEKSVLLYQEDCFRILNNRSIVFFNEEDGRASPELKSSIARWRKQVPVVSAVFVPIQSQSSSSSEEVAPVSTVPALAEPLENDPPELEKLLVSRKRKAEEILDEEFYKNARIDEPLHF